MKCHVSLKHIEGDFGGEIKAQEAPQFKLLENLGSKKPCVRLGDYMFFFKPDESNPGVVPIEKCYNLYRLYPKGTVVVMTQDE